MTEPSELDQLKEQYKRLLHAMQTGVAYSMEFDPAETTPKHLRVGVNSSLRSTYAVVALLVEKGIITEEEYFTKMIQALQQDVADYQEKISARYGGANINLI